MVSRKVPMRQCIGCRDMKIKKELIRIVKTTDGELLIDMTGKQNGRGAYICRSMDCLNQAIRTKGLERSFKMTIQGDTYTKLKEELGKLEPQ